MKKTLLFAALNLLFYVSYAQKENTLESNDYITKNPIVEALSTQFQISFQIDYLPSNFDDFESTLGDYNVAALNTPSGTVNMELALTHNKFRFGASIGFATGDNYDSDRSSNYDTDSLYININETQFGLSFGYTILNSNRFELSPILGIKYQSYRLTNSNIDYKIPLDQYLSERDIDIKMHQAFGIAGFNMAYKFNKIEALNQSCFAIGIYGAYVQKLNTSPWVYSKNNRLTTDKVIDLDNYNVGFYVSLIFND